MKPSGGYPRWQASVITLGTLWGGLVPFVERAWDRWCWWWRTQPRVLRLGREERLVLLRVLDGLEDPAFPLAQRTVRKTATTLHFNRSEAWKDLSRAIKSSPGDAENTYRHLESCRLLHLNLVGSTLTNPETHLIVELAYQGFAAVGRVSHDVV